MENADDILRESAQNISEIRQKIHLLHSHIIDLNFERRFLAISYSHARRSGAEISGFVAEDESIASEIDMSYQKLALQAFILLQTQRRAAERVVAARRRACLLTSFTAWRQEARATSSARHNALSTYFKQIYTLFLLKKSHNLSQKRQLTNILSIWRSSTVRRQNAMKLALQLGQQAKQRAATLYFLAWLAEHRMKKRILRQRKLLSKRIIAKWRCANRSRKARKHVQSKKLARCLQTWHFNAHQIRKVRQVAKKTELPKETASKTLRPRSKSVSRPSSTPRVSTEVAVSVKRPRSAAKPRSSRSQVGASPSVTPPKLIFKESDRVLRTEVLVSTPIAVISHATTQVKEPDPLVVSELEPDHIVDMGSILVDTKIETNQTSIIRPLEVSEVVQPLHTDPVPQLHEHLQPAPPTRPPSPSIHSQLPPSLLVCEFVPVPSPVPSPEPTPAATTEPEHELAPEPESHPVPAPMINVPAAPTPAITPPDDDLETLRPLLHSWHGTCRLSRVIREESYCRTTCIVQKRVLAQWKLVATHHNQLQTSEAQKWHARRAMQLWRSRTQLLKLATVVSERTVVRNVLTAWKESVSRTNSQEVLLTWRKLTQERQLGRRLHAVLATRTCIRSWARVSAASCDQRGLIARAERIYARKLMAWGSGGQAPPSLQLLQHDPTVAQDLRLAWLVGRRELRLSIFQAWRKCVSNK